MTWFFLADSVIAKWRNIKDAFARTIKQKSGQAAKKKYLYHDKLKYLLKNVQKYDNESTIAEIKFDDVLDNNEDIDELELEDEKRTVENEKHIKKLKNTSTQLKRNKKRQLHVDSEILRVLKEKSQDDEDEAFFKSILPHVKKMNEDDKIDFRIEVLNLVRNFSKAQKTT